MAKLTDTQRIVLSKAAAREDGVAVVPANLTKAAAAKIGSRLVARKLMREIRSKPRMPVWREDETGKSISLIITRAGRDAVGMHQAQKIDWSVSNNNKNDKSKNGKPVALPPVGVSPRAGNKQALIVEMLSTERGATLDALIEATGWLPHTTRAALTGLRKKGYVIERIGGEGKGPSAYWVVPATKVAA